MHTPGVELCLQQGTVGGVIIHTEDTQSIQHGLLHLGHSGRCWPLIKAHRKPEGAALAWCTLDPNGTTHHLDQTFGDRQPQACATELAGGRAVSLSKCLEQSILYIGWNTNTRVGDRKTHQGLLVGL